MPSPIVGVSMTALLTAWVLRCLGVCVGGGGVDTRRDTARKKERVCESKRCVCVCVLVCEDKRSMCVSVRWREREREREREVSN